MSKTNAEARRAARPHAPRRKPNAARATPARPQRNLAESPIAWLFSRRDSAGNPLITEAQFNAGERLRADFWFAQMSPNVTQNWSAVGQTQGRRGAPGAGADLADSVIEAADRVRRALEAVGPELSGVLIDVCCHLKGLEDAERKAGLPQRSGKVILGYALSALARHYGFVTSERRRAVAVRHWGATGYRPKMDADEPAEDE